MKKVIIISIAALAIFVAAALLIFLPGSGKNDYESDLDSVLSEIGWSDNSSENTDASDSASSQMSEASSVTENTSSAAQPPETSSVTEQSAASNVSASSEASTLQTTGTPSEPEQSAASNVSTSSEASTLQPPETPSEPEQSASSSAAQTQPQEITSEIPETSEPITAEEPDEPQTKPPVPENVLVTSGDPEHFVRIEFTERRLRFSGFYSGDKVTDATIFNPKQSSTDLFVTGDSFLGSLDITALEPGYYIFVVKLESGAGMYYVFEKTTDGSRPVPAESLPAASNLAASNSPLELPDEGVLLHITTQGSERAAEVLAEIKSLSDQICEGITEDYDKARALAQWVSANMYYDKDASENGVTDEEMTLDFVLQNRRSVCFGWSNLYSALCQAQGIDCFNASGSVVTGRRCFLQTNSADERAHSWNMVVIDGRKIWVDTVWNSSNNYQYGAYNNASMDMQFFDIDNTLLAHDHRVTRFEHRDYFNSSFSSRD